MCFLFLYVGVACHYYGAKMLRMRITENCVFFVFICWGCVSLLRCKGCFYVSGLYVVVTVQNVFVCYVTHEYNRVGNKFVTIT